MKNATGADAPAARLGWRPMLFMAALVLCGVGLLSWSAWRYWHKPTPPALAPGPDVAQQAKDYLRSRNVVPLSGPLARLLADPDTFLVKTQPHPLLGHTAPEFDLADHRDQHRRLGELLGRGPVILVFYYGYHCNHCVGQLFALHDDVQRFRELGAEVVAISADPVELSRERFRQYGEFAFPVLANPGNKVAQAYGVFQPARGGKDGTLRHGTFVIGRDGVIRWAQYGDEPFTGNRTLLYELARLAGRLPDAGRQ